MAPLNGDTVYGTVIQIGSPTATFVHGQGAKDTKQWIVRLRQRYFLRFVHFLVIECHEIHFYNPVRKRRKRKIISKAHRDHF